MAFLLILGIFLWVLLALWPAFIARRKGYSFILFMVLAILISWLLALIIVLLLRNRNISAEERAADKAADDAIAREERG